MAQSLLKLGEIFYLHSSRKPMISRAFAEVAGVKPGGGHAAIRGRWIVRLAAYMLSAGRLAGGGFTRLALAAAMAAALFPFTARAQGVGRQLLHGHVPPAVARFHLPPMSRLPATNRLNLAIAEFTLLLS